MKILKFRYFRHLVLTFCNSVKVKWDYQTIGLYIFMKNDETSLFGAKRASAQLAPFADWPLWKMPSTTNSISDWAQEYLIETAKNERWARGRAGRESSSRKMSTSPNNELTRRFLKDSMSISSASELVRIFWSKISDLAFFIKLIIFIRNPKFL